MFSIKPFAAFCLPSILIAAPVTVRAQSVPVSVACTVGNATGLPIQVDLGGNGVGRSSGSIAANSSRPFTINPAFNYDPRFSIGPPYGYVSISITYTLNGIRDTRSTVIPVKNLINYGYFATGSCWCTFTRVSPGVYRIIVN